LGLAMDLGSPPSQAFCGFRQGRKSAVRQKKIKNFFKKKEN
jgi:hypothetical protein